MDPLNLLDMIIYAIVDYEGTAMKVKVAGKVIDKVAEKISGSDNNDNQNKLKDERS